MTTEAIKRSSRYKAVKAALLDQLQRGGNDLPFFTSLIDDYMSLYVAEKLAADDVARRGVTIFGVGSAGQETAKKNDSVDMLVKVNAQMLKILDQLKLRVDESPAEDDEDL